MATVQTVDVNYDGTAKRKQQCQVQQTWIGRLARGICDSHKRDEHHVDEEI